MLKQHDCAECERLWTEYEEATGHALVIENKMQIAGLTHDSATVLRLQPEVHNTLERRRTLRKQIITHGAESHGQADPAKT